MDISLRQTLSASPKGVPTSQRELTVYHSKALLMKVRIMFQFKKTKASYPQT